CEAGTVGRPAERGGGVGAGARHARLLGGAGALRPCDAQGAREPGVVGAEGPLRARQRLRARRAHRLLPLQRARPVRPAERRAGRLPARARARQHRQADLLEPSCQRAPSTTTSWPPWSADVATPSSGPTTFTCRSCASLTPSAAKPRLYITTVVA